MEVGGKGAWLRRVAVREEKDFELDSFWDREPVEVLKDRGGVVKGAVVCKQMNSRVLGVLEFI